MNCIYRGRSTTDFYLASVLYDSIEDQDLRGVVSLISEKHADANLVLPQNGLAPFHQIAACENRAFAMETALLILQNGGDPNVRSDDGLTPLHLAAAWGRRELVQLLLHCGADPDLQDNCYMTPIKYAREHEHDDIVEMIRMYVDAGIASYFENDRGKEHTVRTLDKILISNGQTYGEYEEIKTEKADVCKQEPIDLEVLPQTNPNEYVRDWCNTLEDQLENLSLSPLDNSANSISNRTFANVTMTRPTVRPLSSCYNSENDSIIGTTNAHNLNIFNEDEITNSCKYSEQSRESGVQTSPSSMQDDYEQQNTVNCDERTPERKTSKDTSSDYFTCTDVSEVIEERENPLNNGFVFSDGDISFVSISEVYKYVDPEKGVCLYEKRVLPTPIPNLNETENFTVSSKSSKLSSLPASFDYDTDSLRKELTRIGFEPGPITKTTKRVYLRKLHHLQKNPQDIIVSTAQNIKKVYSNEIQKTLRNKEWSSDLTPYRLLEEQVVKQFSHPDPTRKWREGTSKASFTYLLLDPRITQNLPGRVDSLSAGELWEIFLSAIFYVGKGKRSRPYHHLYDAIALHKDGVKQTSSTKLQRILDIWNDNQGVICLHIFQNVIPVEAYTREAAMISALQLTNVENLRCGDFYGISATWSNNQKQMLGVYLLFKALRILLNEGERQLSPNDID